MTKIKADLAFYTRIYSFQIGRKKVNVQMRDKGGWKEGRRKAKRGPNEGKCPRQIPEENKFYRGI